MSGMVNGSLGIGLNLVTLAVTVVMLSLLAGWLNFAGINRTVAKLHYRPRKALLWWIVCAPWVMGLVTAVVFALSFYFDFSIGLAHWHHLDVFELTSWHGVSLLAFAVWFAYVMVSKIKVLLSNRRMQASLTTFSDYDQRGFHLLDSQTPSAFSSGFVKPQCYVTTGLVEQLTGQELEIVMAHEQAHVSSFDPLKKWLFMFLAHFYPAKIACQLKLAMSQAMEQAADEFAVSKGFARDLVAATLVKVARIGLLANNSAKHQFTPSMASFFHANALQARVTWLLYQQAEQTRLHYLVYLVPCLFFILAMFSLDSLHHLVELLLFH